MEVSAEIRWFWRGASQPQLQRWFCDTKLHGCAAGADRPRQDTYISDPNQDELGIKVRGGHKGVEIKGLVAVVQDGCCSPPFTGPVQIWAKWSSEVVSLPDAQPILVAKRRWLRVFDTSGGDTKEIALVDRAGPSDADGLPEMGCSVECTEICAEAYGTRWVSLGFEAFGSLNSVATSLRQAMAVLRLRQPPALTDAWCLSYPAWLGRLSRCARQQASDGES